MKNFMYVGLIVVLIASGCGEDQGSFLGPDAGTTADAGTNVDAGMVDNTPKTCIYYPLGLQGFGTKTQIDIATDDTGFLVAGSNTSESLKVKKYALDGDTLNYELDPPTEYSDPDGQLRSLTFSKKWGGFLVSALNRTADNGTMRLDATGKINSSFNTDQWAGAITNNSDGDYYVSAGWSTTNLTADFRTGEIDQNNLLANTSTITNESQRCNYVGGVARRGDLTVMTGFTEERDTGLYSFDFYYIERGKVVTKINIAQTVGATGGSFDCATDRPFVGMGIIDTSEGFLAVWRDKLEGVVKITTFDKGGREGEIVLPYGLNVRKVVRTPNNFVLAMSDPANSKIGFGVISHSGEFIQGFFPEKIGANVSYRKTWPYLEQLDIADNMALSLTSDGKHGALGFIEDSNSRATLLFFDNSCG